MLLVITALGLIVSAFFLAPFLRAPVAPSPAETEVDDELTEIEVATAISKVIPSKSACVVCGNRKYAVLPLSRAAGTPLVPVTCKTCGFTMMFNAVAIGLIDNTGRIIRADGQAE